MADETLTLTIGTDDGDEETVEVSAEMIDLLKEGDQSPAAVAGDLLVMDLSNRIHHMSHHGQGPEGADMDGMEETMMAIFEDRFGQTFAEATGHDH